MICLVDLDDSGQLRATLPDGSHLTRHDVNLLASALFELGFRAETVNSLDWHIDIDRAPLTGTAIQLKVELRRLASL